MFGDVFSILLQPNDVPIFNFNFWLFLDSKYFFFYVQQNHLNHVLVFFMISFNSTFIKIIKIWF
jgi:hypothetical protein